MESEVLVTQMSWHPVGLSVWIPLLASLAPNKARNMTGLQQVTEDLTCRISSRFVTVHVIILICVDSCDIEVKSTISYRRMHLVI